jgi:hypothetical protein
MTVFHRQSRSRHCRHPSLAFPNHGRPNGRRDRSLQVRLFRDRETPRVRRTLRV